MSQQTPQWHGEDDVCTCVLLLQEKRKRDEEKQSRGKSYVEVRS